MAFVPHLSSTDCTHRFVLPPVVVNRMNLYRKLSALYLLGLSGSFYQSSLMLGSSG
jgi:hypothetical protein